MLPSDEYLKGAVPAAIVDCYRIRPISSWADRRANEIAGCGLLDESSVGRRYVLFLGQLAESPRDPGYVRRSECADCDLPATNFDRI